MSTGQQHRRTRQSFTLDDGCALSGERRDPAGQPRGRVLLVHGLGEHLARHDWTMDWFAARGYEVAGFDLRGHGRSEGRRGDGVFRLLLEDLREVVEHLDPAPAPCILFGHSMGGLLALHAALRFPPPTLSALILSAPWLSLAFRPPWHKRVAARLFFGILPGLRIGTGLRDASMSPDPQIVLSETDRRLVHRWMSLRLYFSVLEAAAEARGAAASLTHPLYVLHGESDPVLSCAASAELVRGAVRCPSVRMASLERVRHEPHNDPDRERHFAPLSDWLDRLPLPKS